MRRSSAPSAMGVHGRAPARRRPHDDQRPSRTRAVLGALLAMWLHVTPMRITGPFGELELVLAFRANEDERLRAIPASRAAFMLGGLDPRLADLSRYEVADLSRLLAGGGGRPPVRLRDLLLEEISRGRILVLERTRRPAVVPRHEMTMVLGPDVEPKSWIEIELYDDAGDPVADEPYRLEQANGRVREGTLDRNGKAREEGLDPETCHVTFPRLDGAGWGRAA